MSIYAKQKSYAHYMTLRSRRNDLLWLHDYDDDVVEFIRSENSL